MDAQFCPICQQHVPQNTGWHYTIASHTIYVPLLNKAFCSPECATIALSVCELGAHHAQG